MTDVTNEAPPVAAPEPGSIAAMFKHLKLLPDYRELWAAGSPIGTVELFGKTLNVRCGSEADAAVVAAMTGKSVFARFDFTKDATQQQFLEIIAMALDRNGDASPKVADLMRLAIVHRAKLIEVASAFLWVGGV